MVYHSNELTKRFIYLVVPLLVKYANNRVKRCFENYNEMKKNMPVEWVRAIKKHVDRLNAADNFGVFLQLNLGHPEALHGERKGQYSLRVTGNVRLLLKPLCDAESIMNCEIVEMEGVVDYHGGKESWYVS